MMRAGWKKEAYLRLSLTPLSGALDMVNCEQRQRLRYEAMTVVLLSEMRPRGDPKAGHDNVRRLREIGNV